MTQMIDGLITVPADVWTDLTVANPTLASADTVIQNFGTYGMRVFYGSSGTAPTGGGIVIDSNGIWGGNAAHIWVFPLGGATTISVGLT